MEGQSDSCGQVKVKALEQVKKEEDVNLPSNDESFKPNGGSRLAPMAGSGPNGAVPTPDQLTIFYGGSVVVFDSIPVEKVREIMLIAASAAAAVKPFEMKKAANGGPIVNSPILTRSPSLQSATNGLPSPPAQHYPIAPGSPLCKMQAELPIARRHSLQRFFEKRRDRLGSKIPYPAPAAEKKAEAPKPEASADAGIFGKSAAVEKEIQPQVA